MEGVTPQVGDLVYVSKDDETVRSRWNLPLKGRANQREWYEIVGSILTSGKVDSYYVQETEARFVAVLGRDLSGRRFIRNGQEGVYE